MADMRLGRDVSASAPRTRPALANISPRALTAVGLQGEHQRRVMPSGKRMPQPRRGWRLGGRSWRQLVELRTQFSTELERARAGEHRPGTRRSQRAARAARSIRSPPGGRRASTRPKTCARNWRSRAARPGPRRKAGGQGPISNEEPGAPALALNPHDGNDGNGN
jgi:hypothetical protein